MSFAPVRLAAAMALFATLAGCSSSGPVAGSYVASTEVAALDGVGTRPVSGGDLSLAMAQMPEPGGALGLRERSFANGVRQEIRLSGDVPGFGENTLSIAVQSAPMAAGSRGGVSVYRPTESGIKSEIIAKYPKVAMQIVTQPRRNALGTFGLSIGRHASGARCIFAWQWVDDIRNPGAGASSFGKIGSAFGASSAQPALIRVNMCRKDASVDDLAGAVEGLMLAPPAVLDRALEPGRAAGPMSATRPVSGGDVAVAAADGTLEGALAATGRPVRVASEPSHRRTRVARARPRKAEPETAENSTIPQSPVAPVYQSGPRYMAPVAGQPTQSTAAYAAQPYAGTPASPYGSGVAPVSKSLDPSLPAAAYRGPSGASR